MGDDSHGQERNRDTDQGALSRRDFQKLLGVSGAAVLGGVSLAGCQGGGGETVYRCPYGDQTFDTQDQLKDHLASTHEDELRAAIGPGPYQCPYGEEEFDSTEELRAHIKSDHPDQIGIGLPDSWDEETDVVVVGSGTGLMGALAALDEGADVMVLEKADRAGGTTGISGGTIWIPNNYIAEEESVSDSREESITYLEEEAHNQAYGGLIETFVDTGDEMLQFFEGITGGSYTLSPMPDYHPEYDGGKEIGRVLGIENYDGNRSGGALISAMVDAIEQAGGSIQTSTPVDGLITDVFGRVRGVTATSNGAEITVKAKKGVILAAGGFEWNEEMMTHYLRGPTPYANTPPKDNTGDGIKMAQEVGADLRNMNECWGLPVFKLPDQDRAIGDWFLWRSKPGAIMVNSNGERFANESGDYDTIWRSFFTWDNFGDTEYRNIPGYIIVDNEHWNNYAFAGISPGSEPPEWVEQANSIEDLGAQLGIETEGLASTVETFNQYVENGEDPEYHRGESTFGQIVAGDASQEGVYTCLGKLDEPPYFGAEIWPGTCGTIGGPKINSDAQVLKPNDDIISRLYAAGNNAGVGAPGTGYGGPGNTIGAGMTFNYIAGRQVASEDNWDE